jgi:hypothetical protein
MLFLVPHSSEQTEQLTLFTFALMKRHFSGSRFDILGSPQSNQLVRMLGTGSRRVHHIS